MSEIKMYFKGGKGILNPVDFNGNKIKQGDILTPDSFDDFFNESFYKTHYLNMSEEDIEKNNHKPTYNLKWDEKGFFYGEGIAEPSSPFTSRLYLHDFRFKYTKVVSTSNLL